MALAVGDPPSNEGDVSVEGSIPGLERYPGGGQPTPIFLPGESPWTEEPSRLPWGCKESDTTEQLSTNLC